MAKVVWSERSQMESEELDRFVRYVCRLDAGELTRWELCWRIALLEKELDKRKEDEVNA